MKYRITKPRKLRSGKAVATWVEKGQAGSGDWYAVKIPEVVEGFGWLCPALLLYFDKAPAQIFFQTKPFERAPHV